MFKQTRVKTMLARIVVLGLATAILFGTTACSTTTTTGGKVLTISVLTKDPLLDEAVSKFKQAHPDVTVQVKAYTGSFDKSQMTPDELNKQVAKYTEDMNTQIMSGQGADIITLDGLAFEKYEDKGLLTNLSPMIQTDKNLDNNKYYNNILDAMKYQGNLYVLPTSFRLAMLVANQAALDQAGIRIDDSKWSWEDFAGIAEQAVKDGKGKGQDISALLGFDAVRLLTALVEVNYPTLVDRQKKTANFNSQAFLDLLNMSKQMVDAKLVDTAPPQQNSMDKSLRGTTVFSDQTIRSLSDLALFRSMFKDQTSFLKYPGQGDRFSCTVSGVYGINNNSDNKALAWEFLKFMLSDEVQSSRNLRGFPVNKTAAQSVAQQQMSASQNGKANEVKGMTLKPITQADIDFVNGLIGKVNAYRTMDPEIQQILQEEAPAFFTGQKSAAETAKVIQDRVNTYINE